MRRILLAVAAFAGLLLAPATPAHAGGGSLWTVQDRYERGDVATAVAYVSPAAGQGWLDDGPYFTYAEAGPNRRIPLGRIGIGPTHYGPATMRVDLTFEVPTDLPPGHYALVTCNDRCAKGFGDLSGGTLHLGVDPVLPVVREWPPDEFEIVNLPDGAKTTWPTSSSPAPSAAAIKPPTQSAPVVPAARPVRAPAAQPLDTGPEASAAALLVGGALTAVFVGLVLVGLRDS